EWVHVQLHQQKGMISLSPPTICNSAELSRHCVPETDFEEFFSDMGVKEQYDAQEVLLWLGY
ncbi:hypothetical protein ACS40J_22670, partial [Salmonella enterica]